MIPLVRKLAAWTDEWVAGVTAAPPTFNDSSFTAAPQQAQQHLIRHLKSRIDRLVSIVDREQKKVDRASYRPSSGKREFS
jgi:hypothetical protein